MAFVLLLSSLRILIKSNLLQPSQYYEAKLNHSIASKDFRWAAQIYTSKPQTSTVSSQIILWLIFVQTSQIFKPMATPKFRSALTLACFSALPTNKIQINPLLKFCLCGEVQLKIRPTALYIHLRIQYLLEDCTSFTVL